MAHLFANSRVRVKESWKASIAQVRSAECEVRSPFEVRSAKCVRSAGSEVRSAKSEVRSAECGVRSAECGVRSAGAVVEAGASVASAFCMGWRKLTDIEAWNTVDEIAGGIQRSSCSTAGLSKIADSATTPSTRPRRRLATSPRALAATATPEFARFVDIAFASQLETQTNLLIAQSRGYLSRNGGHTPALPLRRNESHDVGPTPNAETSHRGAASDQRRRCTVSRRTSHVALRTVALRTPHFALRTSHSAPRTSHFGRTPHFAPRTDFARRTPDFALSSSITRNERDRP